MEGTLEQRRLSFDSGQSQSSGYSNLDGASSSSLSSSLASPRIDPTDATPLPIIPYPSIREYLLTTFSQSDADGRKEEPSDGFALGYDVGPSEGEAVCRIEPFSKADGSIPPPDFISSAHGAPTFAPVEEDSFRVERWFQSHTFKATDWTLADLHVLKETTRNIVSVVIPAKNEEATIASVVSMVRALQMEGLVDEIVVMDSHSTDRTAVRATEAGAKVYHVDDVLAAEAGSRPGKGEALWKSLGCTVGDVIVFVDGDLIDPHPELVTGLLGPLLIEGGIDLVKGFYDRPLKAGVGEESNTDGGRVTELMARPLIALNYPLLSGVIQPLAGEYAARRTLLERIPMCEGYGVEMGMLIDTLGERGLDSIAQVDLGIRHHSHQSTKALGRMATQIMQVVMNRKASSVGGPAGKIEATLTQVRARRYQRDLPTTDAHCARTAKASDHHLRRISQASILGIRCNEGRNL